MSFLLNMYVKSEGLLAQAGGLIAQADDPSGGGEVTKEVVNSNKEPIVEDKSLWDLIFGYDPQTGDYSMTSIIIMTLLFVFSIAAIYIFVERFLAIQKAQKEEKNFMMQVKSFIQNGDLNSAKNLCATTDNSVARMIGRGISKIGKPLNDIKASVENQGRLEVGVLEKRLTILATIAGAAPMIGFLGTTLGMIGAFNKMQGLKQIKLGEIAPGIEMAMVTTVGGLIVGIIAYMAYNYLTSKVENVVLNMQGSSVEFIDLLDEPGK